MRIAFDLDDTLIPCGRPFASGLLPQGLTARFLMAERLRAGVDALFHGLRNQGWEVLVYTSSRRTVFSVHLLFAAHGLRVDGVINDQLHHERAAQVGQGERWPLKNPPAFGIDVLVDDSESVHRAGRRHGFRVVQVLPEDDDWVGKVRGGVKAPSDPIRRR